MLWRRYSESLLRKKVYIGGTWLIRELESCWKSFAESKRDNVTFRWPQALRNCVHGVFLNTKESLPWFTTVERIYVPMRWDGNKWVGLHINLKTRYIDIFELKTSSYKLDRVRMLVEPIAQMLEYLIKDVCFYHLNPVEEAEQLKEKLEDVVCHRSVP